MDTKILPGAFIDQGFTRRDQSGPLFILSADQYFIFYKRMKG